MIEGDYQQTRPWQQLLYLFLLWIGCTIIGLAITLGIIAGVYGSGMARDVLFISNTGQPGFIGAFRIFIALGNTVFPFLAPAFILGYWIMARPYEYIKANNYFNWILLLIVPAFMLFFLPVIDITGYYNQQLSLPQSLHWLDQWIRETEKQNAGIVKMILNMKHTGDLILSLIIVGLLPAVSEEFFFRGCMQPIFMRWTKNIHVSVWITAFMFSFLHFEFLGFVPRMLLGAALGYFFAYGNSIWPAVMGHFLNNAIAVIGMYLYQHHVVTTNPDGNVPMFNQLWIYLLSFAVSVVFMLVYRKVSITNYPDTDGEELG